MGSDVDGYPKLMTRKPALLRRDTRMVIDAGVRPRPCTTMTDSAPSGGEDEQANKIHRSAQVSATWSLPQCVRKRFKALFEGARRYDDWRSDDHVYSRKRQGLHLPIPGRDRRDLVAEMCKGTMGTPL